MLNLKKKIKLHITEINSYRYLALFYSCKWDILDRHKRRFFQLSFHKRQQYFTLGMLSKKKIVTLSTGQLIKPWVKGIKYYKKDRKNIGLTVAAIKYRFYINNIGFLFCKNYNYRHYLWLKKYIKVTNPHFSYILFTKSWPYSPKSRRRIKRDHYKEIFKKQINFNK